MTREASWSEMATAVMAHLDAYGADAIYDVWHVLNGYTVTATAPCTECTDPTETEADLAEPTPGLSPRMRAVLDVLADGRPRTASEIGDALGVWRQSVGGTLAALARRGRVSRADALWWRR